MQPMFCDFSIIFQGTNHSDFPPVQMPTKIQGNLNFYLQISLSIYARFMHNLSRHFLTFWRIIKETE